LKFEIKATATAGVGKQRLFTACTQMQQQPTISASGESFRICWPTQILPHGVYSDAASALILFHRISISLHNFDSIAQGKIR